jgi:hypothetical protein
VGGVEVVVGPLEALHLHRLAGVGLDDPDAVERFRQARQHRTDAVAHGEVAVIGVPLEPPRRQHDEGHERQAAEGQQRRRHQQEDEREADEQHVGHQHQQAVLDQLLHGVHVGGEPGHDHAARMSVVVRQTEALEVGEQPDPEVAQEAFAEQAHGHDLAGAEQVVEDCDHGVGDDRAPQHRFPPGDDAVVDGDPNDVGPRELGEHVADDGDHRRGELAPVGAHEPGRAPHHLAGRRGVEPVLLGDPAGEPHQAGSPTAAARTSP